MLHYKPLFSPRQSFLKKYDSLSPGERRLARSVPDKRPTVFGMGPKGAPPRSARMGAARRGIPVPLAFLRGPVPPAALPKVPFSKGEGTGIFPVHLSF